eukprot:6469938-Amphidinium_carterae.1
MEKPCVQHVKHIWQYFGPPQALGCPHRLHANSLQLMFPRRTQHPLQGPSPRARRPIQHLCRVQLIRRMCQEAARLSPRRSTSQCYDLPPQCPASLEACQSRWQGHEGFLAFRAEAQIALTHPRQWGYTDHGWGST